MTTAKEKLAIEDADISYYTNAWGDNDSQDTITVRDWLDGIRMGRWQDHVLKVRLAIGNKDLYSKLKRDGPGVTPGARFSHRKKGGEISYSMLMVIDLDHLDEDRAAVKAMLAVDPYVYAVFDSIGGQGLCLLFRVDVSRWDESFLGIQEYLGKKYGLFEKFDSSGKDISRLRFVSWDPDARIKDVVPPVFKEYPKKEPRRKPIPETFIDTPEDFDFVFQQVCDSGVDITPHYQQRLKVCFALIDKFGEGGWPYFNRICQNHAEYDEKKTERMWKSAMGYGAQKVTIKTFYYFCKEAQLDISRPFTREVTSIAAAHKKQGGTIGGTVETLKKMQGFDPAETEPIVKQVFECREEFKTDETLFDQLEMFLRNNYPMIRNSITRYCESPDGKVYEETEYNGIWVHAVKVLGDKVSDKMVSKLIASPFTPNYNPFLRFFNEHKDRQSEGHIRKLADTIHSNMGFGHGEFFPDYVYFYLRKWLLGVISSMLGQHSPLVLVMTGGQNAGKTEWFRRLLPPQLRSYYGETQFEKGQDDEILMCKKLILFNDEFGGMNKHDVKKFKNLTSKQTFSLREPYGRAHVDLNRIAVLCGSSNEDDILNDPTGNRRILPVRVTSFDFDAYNAIDKTDLLMEVYNAYQAGERHHLTSDDIKQLNENTAEFEDICIERELIQHYYRVPTPQDALTSMFLSATEIKVFLEKCSQQKIGIKRLAQELKKAGFESGVRKVKGSSVRGYLVMSDTEHAPF
ncbi:VapE domain-containing protein [Spirosoma fluminis]